MKKRIRQNSRRPEVQDADNREGFVSQKGLNVSTVLTKCECAGDVK
jgi:hypothetical protein